MMELPTPQPPPHRIIAAEDVLRALGVHPYQAPPVVDQRPVDPRAPTYTVALSASPPTGGSAGGDGSFTSGTNVTIFATAELHYDFVNWTYINGLEASTDATYTFTLTSNTTLVANFVWAPIEYPAGVPWNVFRAMVGHMDAANASRDTINTFDKAQSPTVLRSTPAASDAKPVGRENQDELAPPPPKNTEPGH